MGRLPAVLLELPDFELRLIEVVVDGNIDEELFLLSDSWLEYNDVDP